MCCFTGMLTLLWAMYPMLSVMSILGEYRDIHLTFVNIFAALPGGFPWCKRELRVIYAAQGAARMTIEVLCGDQILTDPR